MRLPQKPPSLSDLQKTADVKRMGSIIMHCMEWAKADVRYLHWDDLRRRPAPKSFSHQDWWLGLKIARLGQLRPLALKDDQGQAFQFAQPDSLTELLHKIDRGLGTVLGLPEAIDSPATRDSYVVNSLIQESITSSQLEGAATTREVAKELLRTARPPRDKSERMILNNYLTMQRIRDLRDVDLSTEMVFELHHRVTENTLDKSDAAGRFRLPDEDINVVDEIEGTVFHHPPPAGQLPARMAAMCDFANGKTPGFFVHPVIRAIILHFWLAYDHPFVDGNGRTARALFYWSMLRHKYQLFEYISISDILLRAPAQYAEAFLHTETDGNDLTYFILHQAGVIHEAVATLHDYLRRKKAELETTGRCLHGMQDLNHRQQALLAHALREPHTRYLIVAHQRSHAVTHQTARDDLFDLVKRGLLTVRKAGRSYQFLAPGDLTEKLGQLATTPP